MTNDAYDYDSVTITNGESGESESVNVLDLLDPSQPRADKETRASRLGVCKECPSFKLKSVCNECGCFMPVKTWLSNATCPLGKW